jgi:recombination associated protein RdgC
MFRTLRLYRVESPWPRSEAALADRLAEAAFAPCSAFTAETAGFEPPTGRDTDLLCRRIGGADLLSLRRQTRLLPAAAVNEVLSERIARFVNRMGRDPGRKERRQLRDEVYGELLPKSLLRSQRIRGFHLASEHILAVEAAAPARAELFLDRLRTALGSLVVKPLTFGQPVGGLLNTHAARSRAEATAHRARVPAARSRAARSSVQWLDMDLSGDSAPGLVQDGMELERLGVEFDDVLTCVLDRDCVLRKIRLPDADAAETDDDDPLARLDAEFVMLTGSVRRLLEALKGALKGYA